jgi:membrane protein DedA with SNARE-associated domain/pimeloyl-ACP methyl ester carboxylesterase
MKTWHKFALLYVALLACSHAARWMIGEEPGPRPGQRMVAVGQMRIAHTDSGGDGPVILLLHGAPYLRSLFGGIEPALAAHARVIAPDLPGFGGSTRRVGDYSSETQARHVLEFLDALDVGRVHVVAHGQGAAVALHLAERAPERVASLTMLSAAGVEELELLGDYRLNRALYGAQWAAVWLAGQLLPHFGLLERLPVDLAYARALWDSDPRPLRGMLERYAGPMLILHGTRDGLVPPAAAQEHYRIVPQSGLEWFDGGHLLVMRRAEALAGRITAFVQQVERGAAVTRAEAPRERREAAAALFESVPRAPPRGVGLAVLIMLLVAVTLVSEDLACIGAGLLVAREMIGFAPAVGACLAGIFIGNLFLFLVGRFAGRPILRRAPLRWMLRETDLQRTEEWFARRGAAVIFFCRFVPGTRAPVFFAAGLLRVGIWKFVFYLMLAAALWTPALVGLSAWVGERMFVWFGQYRRLTVTVILATVAVLWVVVRLIVPLCSVSGRRMLLSGWRRLWRRERGPDG